MDKRKTAKSEIIQEFEWVESVKEQGLNFHQDYLDFLATKKLSIEDVSSEKKKDITHNIKNDIETYITQSANRKNKVYFDIKKIMNIDEINLYFNFIIIVSERGIGKTFSSLRMCEEHTKREKGSWIILRNSVKEKERLFDSHKNNWFMNRGWSGIKTSGFVFKTPEAKDSFNKKNKKEMEELKEALKSTTKKEKKAVEMKVTKSNKVVGHFEALASAATMRSIEKEDVNLIVYDEFSNWAYKRSQFSALTDYLRTVVRDKKVFNVVLFANYREIDNEILRRLGVRRTHKKQEIVKLDWTTRSVIIHLPKGVFNRKSGNFTLAERLSLGSYESFKEQMGAAYAIPEKHDILDPRYASMCKEKKFLFHFKVGYDGYNFFKLKWHDEKKGTTYAIFDDATLKLEGTKIHKLVIFKKDLLTHHDHKLMNVPLLKKILKAQKQGKIEYRTKWISEQIKEVLTIVNKIKFKEKIEIKQID